MKIKDQLEDYVEYLVEHNNVQSLSDLTREERTRLSFLILRDNFMYVKMIRIMHKTIKDAVKQGQLTRTGSSHDALLPRYN
jgi:hypothetical protein